MILLNFHSMRLTRKFRNLELAFKCALLEIKALAEHLGRDYLVLGIGN